MSLVLKNALNPQNIQSGFRVASIQPFNKEAMIHGMGPSEVFQQSQIQSDIFQEEELSSQENEVAHDIQVEEILVEGISSPLRHSTHYYVDIEEDSSPNRASNDNSNMVDSNALQPNVTQTSSHFFRLPIIQEPKDFRIKNEPLIDYSHLQILISQSHVEKLRIISE